MFRIPLAAVLAAVSASALAAAPDARTCPRPALPDGGERERAKPLPVPADLRSVMGSSLHHYAISTRSGGRICVDTSWIETAKEHRLSSDGRFVSFAWLGYETYGTKLIDRSGRGKVHEIGSKPVFSPSRRRFAAIDQTESEFGTLSGFKVWQVTPARIAELGKVEDIPRMYDWRIDRWVGEACLELSAIPFEEQQRDVEYGKMRRARFAAKVVGGSWRVARATGAGRCAS